MNQPIISLRDTPQTVVKGDTWEWEVDITFDSKTTSATIEDITAVDATIKNSQTAEDYIFHHDLLDGGITEVIDGDTGCFTIRFAPEEMQQLELGKAYYYDCQITYGADDDIRTVVRGRLNITYEVTTPGQEEES
jgi:hypothetical protein